MWQRGLYNHAYKFGAKFKLGVKNHELATHTLGPIRTKCVCSQPVVVLMFREKPSKENLHKLPKKRTKGCIHSILLAASETCVFPLVLKGVALSLSNTSERYGAYGCGYVRFWIGLLFLLNSLYFVGFSHTCSVTKEHRYTQDRFRCSVYFRLERVVRAWDQKCLVPGGFRSAYHLYPYSVNAKIDVNSQRWPWICSVIE